MRYLSGTVLILFLSLYIFECSIAEERKDGLRSLSLSSSPADPEAKFLQPSFDELVRVKRKSKIKIKTKGHKTKIKIKTGGGGGFPRRSGLLLGAGLIGGGLIGASLMSHNMHFHHGRYGRYQFERYGHTLILTSQMNVTGFNYSTEHGHYHDLHGHFLSQDGLYYNHDTHEFVHDAREHIPIETVARLISSQSPYIVHDREKPHFRYYPYNQTHGVWEYSVISVSEKITRDSGPFSTSSNLVIAISLVFAFTSLRRYI